MILQALRAELPALFHAAQIARLYNALTGASLSHLDLEQMSIFDRAEVILLIENADLL